MKPTLFVASAQTRTRAIAMRLFAGISISFFFSFSTSSAGMRRPMIRRRTHSAVIRPEVSAGIMYGRIARVVSPSLE